LPDAASGRLADRGGPRAGQRLAAPQHLDERVDVRERERVLIRRQRVLRRALAIPRVGAEAVDDLARERLAPLRDPLCDGEHCLSVEAVLGARYAPEPALERS
jgi:hypothetical protein